MGISVTATLVMAEVPALEVDSPTDGLHTNDPTVHVNGTTEPTIIVRVHVEGEAEETSNSTISREDGTFDILIGVFEGLNEVTVQAEDRTGNTTNVTRHVVLDVTEPHLEVVMEFLNGTRVPWNDLLGGYVVGEDKIALNGSFWDDLSETWNLTLRLNGEARVIYISFPGKLYERWELDEGINTLIVDVTDEAGNRASVILYVTLDSLPPALFVYTPLDNQFTRNATVLVTGLTEPRLPIDVMVKASAGTRAYDLHSTADGTFEVPVRFYEGIQKLWVTVKDQAGNANVTDLNIILDTTPPEFSVIRPEENPTYTNIRNFIIVVGFRYECTADMYVNDRPYLEVGGVEEFEVALEEGENTITLRAVDKVANEWVVVLTIHLDTVPPKLGVTSPTVDSMITNDPTIHFEGWVVDSYRVDVVHKGTDHRVTLTSGDWEDGEWKYDLELTEDDREMDILVRAWDRVGNEDLWYVHVVLDIEPPTLTVDTIDFGYLNRDHFTITGTTSEDVVRVTANGVEGELVNGSFTIIIHHDDIGGSLLIEAIDAAGNVASDLISPIVLDDDPPTFKLDYPRTTDGDNVTIRGTCSADVMEVRLDGEWVDVENGSFQIRVDLPKDGKNRFDLTFIDKAGNTVTKTITITKGAETPGPGVPLVLLGIALVATLSRRLRTRLSGAI